MMNGQKNAPKRHRSTSSSSAAVPFNRIPASSTGQQPAPPTEEPERRDVATWTYQAGTDAPVGYASWRPWKRQERARVGTPVARLYRPFQDRTVADADRRANGACLPLPPGTELCKCGAVLLHESHKKGELHRGRMPEEPRRAAAGHSEAAKRMLCRAEREPAYAEWLLAAAGRQAAGESAPPRRRKQRRSTTRDESRDSKGVAARGRSGSAKRKPARVGGNPKTIALAPMLPPPPPPLPAPRRTTPSPSRRPPAASAPAPLATTSAAAAASAGTDCAPEATLLVRGTAHSSPADPEPGAPQPAVKEPAGVGVSTTGAPTSLLEGAVGAVAPDAALLAMDTSEERPIVVPGHQAAEPGEPVGAVVNCDRLQALAQDMDVEAAYWELVGE
ncbi:uncharacterized protein LOC144152052 [Haemaphysalis longicornis]